MRKNIYFLKVNSVVPMYMDIPVYIATVYLSGTEEPSPSCCRLPHKHELCKFQFHCVHYYYSNSTI